MRADAQLSECQGDRVQGTELIFVVVCCVLRHNPELCALTQARDTATTLCTAV